MDFVKCCLYTTSLCFFSFVRSLFTITCDKTFFQYYFLRLNLLFQIYTYYTCEESFFTISVDTVDMNVDENDSKLIMIDYSGNKECHLKQSKIKVNLNKLCMLY